MAVAWHTDAAVSFIFNAASDSTARTIPSADGVFFSLSMYNASTPVVTIAGASATISYSADDGAGAVAYQAVFVGAASGSQTVAVSGGDAADWWGCGYRGLTGIDTTTPFDGQVTDTASGASIAITTTADGIAVATTACSTDPTTTDTALWEEGTPVQYQGTAYAAGTGGSVSIDWTGGGTHYISIGVNLRAVAAGGDPEGSLVGGKLIGGGLLIKGVLVP